MMKEAAFEPMRPERVRPAVCGINETDGNYCDGDGDDCEGGVHDGSMLPDIQPRSHSQTPTVSYDRNDDDAGRIKSARVPLVTSSTPLPSTSQDDSHVSANKAPPKFCSADEHPAITSELEAGSAGVGEPAGEPAVQLSVLATDDAADEDFHYLREYALERVDALGHSDDLTIPINEDIQFLGQTDAPSTLRP